MDKNKGKVYTPDYLVKIILEQGHYRIDNISKKHVIDNSCGDGQFMVHIVDLYCKDFFTHSNDLSLLKSELETYIHAIDIDDVEDCKKRCSKVVFSYGIEDVCWDFICANSLEIQKFNEKMDFVIGNPPYVRVHNLQKNFNAVKEFSFANKGMTDLFIAFYEVGLKMLKPTGILCYITPSSFFTSIAGASLREYLVENKLLESLCDLKHFQAFNAVTYTAIVCLNKAIKNESVKYFEFDSDNYKTKFIEDIKICDYYIKKAFYFSISKNLNMLKAIFQNDKISDVKVKNGYATLSDKNFICDFNFSSKYIIPVLKASRAKWSKIFFPYDENSHLIDEEELKKDEKMYAYILSKKEDLQKRDSEKKEEQYWYAFGRSQGISDTFCDKLAINALIRKSSDLKIIDVPAKCGIYSGLYITSEKTSKEEVKKVLQDDEFAIYISLLGKYKNGGYYTFSSKDVKYYLDYKLGEKNDYTNFIVFRAESPVRSSSCGVVH